MAAVVLMQLFQVRAHALERKLFNSYFMGMVRLCNIYWVGYNYDKY